MRRGTLLCEDCEEEGLTEGPHVFFFFFKVCLCILSSGPAIADAVPIDLLNSHAHARVGSTYFVFHGSTSWFSPWI